MRTENCRRKYIIFPQTYFSQPTFSSRLDGSSAVVIYSFHNLIVLIKFYRGNRFTTKAHWVALVYNGNSVTCTE